MRSTLPLSITNVDEVEKNNNIRIIGFSCVTAYCAKNLANNSSRDDFRSNGVNSSLLMAIRWLIILVNSASTSPKRTCKILSMIARLSLSTPVLSPSCCHSCRPSSRPSCRPSWSPCFLSSSNCC